MSRFAITNAALAIAVGLAWTTGHGWLLGGVAFLLWSVVVARGVTSLRSGFFCRALCQTPVHGGSTPPAVALTFDDGPDSAVTPRLLDLLERRGVAAAFFAIGRRVAVAPEIARRCREAGHLVENHSDRHAPWTNFLFTGAMTRELARCNAAIEAATGVRPRFYRPPFGLANHATGPAATGLGLEVVGWQVRGLDTRTADPVAVVERVMNGLRAGGIVLLHDGGRDPDRVIAVVEGLLDRLDERGFEVVRLDRLSRS